MGFNFKALLFVVGVTTLALYFFPSVVGFIRKKRNKWAIFWLDLLLGWTVIGWIVTMVWALGNDAPQSTSATG